MRITINDILQEYSPNEIIEALEVYKVKNESALIVALKFTRRHKLLDSIEKDKQMNVLVEKIKRIREQYGYPIWLINEALKYYNNDEDKVIERLIEIYNAIGDHPNVVIRRNIGNFMNEVRSKNLMCKDNSVRNDNYVNGYGTVADTLRFLKRLSVIESQQTDADDN